MMDIIDVEFVEKIQLGLKIKSPCTVEGQI